MPLRLKKLVHQLTGTDYDGLSGMIPLSETRGSICLFKTELRPIRERVSPILANLDYMMGTYFISFLNYAILDLGIRVYSASGRPTGSMFLVDYIRLEQDFTLVTEYAEWTGDSWHFQAVKTKAQARPVPENNPRAAKKVARPFVAQLASALRASEAFYSELHFLKYLKHGSALGIDVESIDQLTDEQIGFALEELR